MEQFDLDRFLRAQEPVMPQVLRELRDGRKRSHWMWFVFPQLRSLGRSETARHYGLASLAEARAYWGHPVLGPRLRDCTALVNAATEHDIRDILGTPDDLKFRSCTTVFHRAAPEEPAFTAALARFFGGAEDASTLALLGEDG